MEEHDIDVGEFLVMETRFGAIRVGVHDIGYDDEGEPIVEIAMDLPSGWECVVGGKKRQTCGVPTCKGLPRLWFLCGYFFSHRVREQIFLPMFNEFLEDYVFTRKRIRRKRDRRLLAIAFTLRTVGMLWQCAVEGLKSVGVPSQTAKPSILRRIVEWACCVSAP